MAAKHTPGPWAASGIDVLADWQDDKACRPVIFRGDKGPYDGAVITAEAQANAILGAAAPDLLEVAKRYEKWEANLINSQEAWSRGFRVLPQLTQELWDELLKIQGMRNAAIAKATGGDK